MKKRGGGFIVNISSLAGKNAFPKGAAYNASKFALVGFSEALMQEVRYDNIRVAYIMPGSVDTRFSGNPPAGEQAWKISQRCRRSRDRDSETAPTLSDQPDRNAAVQATAKMTAEVSGPRFEVWDPGHTCRRGLIRQNPWPHRPRSPAWPSLRCSHKHYRIL